MSVISQTSSKDISICASVKKNVGLNGYFVSRMETEADKLWLPKNSTFLVNKKWKSEHFPNRKRNNVALFTHEENVLTPAALLKVGVFCLQ